MSANFPRRLKMMVFSLLCLIVISCGYKTKEPSQSMTSLYVGTYDAKGSDGIYGVSVNNLTGEFSSPKLVIPSKDPSFLAQSNDGILYAVVREGKGVLASYKKNKENEFQLIDKQSTMGASPCYIAFNNDQSFVATANYSGGSSTIFSLKGKGVINPSPVVVQHEGSSVTPRQKSPHAHWVQWSKWDANKLYVVDLGIDEVKQYQFDSQTGTVTQVSTAWKAKPGAGPRQMVFHPTLKRVYVLNELDNTLMSAAVNDDGTFNQTQLISTLPKDFTEHNQASHIVITADGSTLYTSNRGHNSIAQFSLSKEGVATLVGTTSTLGDWPRYFTLLEEEKLMLVANRKTSDIFSFHVLDDGSLKATGHKTNIQWPSYIEPAKF